jgi:hypothetical membrane protein
MWVRNILFSFSKWSDNTVMGDGIRKSVWLFPVIEICHLLALAVLGGVILLVNLRLLGVGLFEEDPLPELAQDVWPLFLGSIAAMIVTGYSLFTSEALKDFFNWGFRVKMTSLLLALIFTFTVHRKVTLADEGSISPLWRKVTAIVSLVLWLTVGLGGRSIGYITSTS